MQKQRKMLALLIVLLCGWMRGTPGHADEINKTVAAENTEIAPLSPEQAVALLGGQTLITLHLKNATPHDFFTELWRQAQLKPFGAYTAANKTLPLISIDCTDEPFWSVLRKVAENADVSVNEEGSSSDRISLSPVNGAQGLNGIALFEGPFLFTATSITRSQVHTVHLGANPTQPVIQDRLQLSLHIFSDPKFPLAPESASITVEQAVDDKGNSLLDKKPLIYPVNSNGRFTPEVSLPLVPRPADGGHIASLKGVLHVFITAKTDTWEIADIAAAGDSVHGALPQLTAAGTVVPEGAAQYSLSKVTPIDRGYELDLSCLCSRTPLDIRGFSEAMFADLRALDDKGNDLEIQETQGRSAFGLSDSRNKALQGFTMHFKIRRGKNNSTSGPVKLIWKIPVAFRAVDAPFEFSNLPLP